MSIHAYDARGFSGRLVSVEVDIRRGIPGVDIVGLPDNAIREARDRIRIALRRSQFEVPKDRVLVSLSPAGERKEGAAYDLPIAVAILIAMEQVAIPENHSILCAGELMLDGRLRAVNGILSAVAAGRDAGIRHFLVPNGNLEEAMSLDYGVVLGIDSLVDVANTDFKKIFTMPTVSRREDVPNPVSFHESEFDLKDLKGQALLKRALEIAAVGRHHLLLFGPPGSGKTLASRIFPSLLPDLDRQMALAATRIHSQAGKHPENVGLMKRPPFREPHHSASTEGILGGGLSPVPGEVSLAHGGVLFLDEAPEFGGRTIQALRESLESKRIEVARAGRSWWYPADYQLILAMNVCACGNLGREEAPCLCRPSEITRYWKRLGGAVLDRIDLRIPVKAVDPSDMLQKSGESSSEVAYRVRQARRRQADRYRNEGIRVNANLSAGQVIDFVHLSVEAKQAFPKTCRKLGFSSRAAHGVLKVSRSIADLEGSEKVEVVHLFEAFQHRRYGDRDIFWQTL